jgi:uncharacterized protein (DUF488 family)
MQPEAFETRTAPHVSHMGSSAIVRNLKDAALTAKERHRTGFLMARSHLIFTIGHSTKSIDEFVELLQAGQVRQVVDIRSVPRSRTNPSYNLDALPDALASRQIAHTRIAELGGLRGKSKTVPPEVNGFWKNQSFHNYADYALSPEFRSGLDALISLAADRPVAIMCSEAVWWRCHRRIVADYLLQRGWAVAHLMGRDRVEPAAMTKAARPIADGLVYPAPAAGDEASSISPSPGSLRGS